VDTYFPRAHLIECLRRLQAEFPTVAINLRITTMQGGERLVLEATCALAVTITDVPELSRGTIERQHLCDAQMVTVCAPSHPLAAICDHGKDARCDKARRIGDDRCLKTQRFAVAREPLCTFTCSKRRHKCQEATLDSDTVNRDYTLWIDPEPKSTARRVFPTGPIKISISGASGDSTLNPDTVNFFSPASSCPTQIDNRVESAPMVELDRAFADAVASGSS
jgi:hypothetical protein